jgi:hypothetical protein
MRATIHGKVKHAPALRVGRTVPGEPFTTRITAQGGAQPPGALARKDREVPAKPFRIEVQQPPGALARRNLPFTVSFLSRGARRLILNSNS